MRTRGIPEGKKNRSVMDNPGSSAVMSAVDGQDSSSSLNVTPAMAGDAVVTDLTKKNAFNLFQFTLDLPDDAVVTDLTKLMKLIKSLEEETKVLYKCSYGRTRSLINCLNSWSALDRIIHSNQFLWTPYQYLEVKLMIIGYSLRGLQIYTDPERQPNSLTLAYICKDHALITAITKCIDQVSDAGLKQIDEISARKLVFLRSAYLFEDKPCNESIPIDAYINEYIMGLRSCYADVSFKRSDKLMAGSHIMADFRRELKSDVRNAVDQFRITVCPAEISHEAIEELIRIVFIEDKQKESYDTLSLKQRLDKLYEQDHIGSSEFSDALVPAKESGGSHRGETKTNSPSIKESESALCRKLIVARLNICGSKHAEFNRVKKVFQSLENYTLKTLELTLQQVLHHRFYGFWRNRGKLKDCLSQLLEEVRGCLPLLSDVESEDNHQDETNSAQPSAPPAPDSAQFAVAVVSPCSLTGMPNPRPPSSPSTSSSLFPPEGAVVPTPHSASSAQLTAHTSANQSTGVNPSDGAAILINDMVESAGKTKDSGNTALCGSRRDDASLPSGIELQERFARTKRTNLHP